MALKFIDKYATGFVQSHEIEAIKPQILAAHKTVHEKSGLGADFLGWLDLPENYDKAEFAAIKASAEKIRKNTEVFIVIGIGGSYLGARAAIEFIRSPMYNQLKKDTPDIYFAGNSISADYLNELLDICEGRDVSINVISKSGTTTEPAVAFRIFKKLLEDKYGAEGARERIFCTTDKARGTLKELADREGYQTFVVPDDVGGRYSVLTAVGLLPMAVAGIDLDKVMEGALAARQAFATEDFDNNDCYRYAAMRNILYRKGKAIEIMVSYEPRFTMMNEWYKQLYGESEGGPKGYFPCIGRFLNRSSLYGTVYSGWHTQPV